jgi:carboxypeptidase PM20D1
MLKRLILVVFVALLILAAVLSWRTMRFTSRQVRLPSAVGVVVDPNLAAARLAAAIRFPTVSSQLGESATIDAFQNLHRYLEENYPQVQTKLTREVVADHSLLYLWQGSDANLKPVLLMSHLDVVPVAPGTEKSWTRAAFGGEIVDGYIWGRGTMDDKVGVLAILESIEQLLAEGFAPRRTIYLAFGHDEEVGGQRGAGSIAKLLNERGVRFEYILDEGGAIVKGIVPGIAAPVALVSIAEKGYASLELLVEGEGGHSSMPPPQTSIGILSEAIRKIEDHPQPLRFTRTVEEMFAYLGPEMPIVPRTVFANLWLLGPLARRQMAATTSGAASLRTTSAATMIEGGVKDNVLPPHARAVVNFRLLSGETTEGLIERISSLIADDRVKIAIYQNMSNAPSRETNSNAPSFALLQRTVAQIFPDALFAPNLSIGGTDTKHYEGLSENIYRFLPIRVDGPDLSRIHGVDERVAVDNYAELIRFYAQLIRNSEAGE